MANAIGATHLYLADDLLVLACEPGFEPLRDHRQRQSCQPMYIDLNDEVLIDTF